MELPYHHTPPKPITLFYTLLSSSQKDRQLTTVSLFDVSFSFPRQQKSHLCPGWSLIILEEGQCLFFGSHVCFIPTIPCTAVFYLGKDALNDWLKFDSTCHSSIASSLQHARFYCPHVEGCRVQHERERCSSTIIYISCSMRRLARLFLTLCLSVSRSFPFLLNPSQHERRFWEALTHE